MKISELRKIIKQELEEISTTGGVPGYNSKYFLSKYSGSYDIDYSGLEGTGKNRRTRNTNLSEKEMGSGMTLVRKIIREMIKEIIEE